MMRLRVACCAVLLCPASFAVAQTSIEPSVPEKAGKELHAYRVKGTPPRIDGRLDDEAWTLAQSVDDMVQNDPDNMQPPS